MQHKWRKSSQLSELTLFIDMGQFIIPLPTNFNEQLMKKIFSGVMLIACIVYVNAQQGKQSDLNSQAQKLEALKGTYQLRARTRVKTVFPVDLADIIEKNRKEDAVNVIRLNSETDLIIYPKNNILNNSELNKR